ncbi:MAG: hypothetical protein M3450_10465 [Actinomycetota bacterium]|nr:hypothetical protein [Actinomycetota bacterium]
MSLSRKFAVGLASLALTLGVSAGPAFAAHAGQYHATSPGNGKCHDTGPRGSTMPDPSSKGQAVAAENSDTISPFACP